MAGVFISYRRADCAGHAGRLYDRLVERLGSDAVFMDIDAIEPGADFGVRIDEAIGACDSFLALIGDDWLGIADASGRRRLDDPGDLVRREIATALRREDVRVVPVLIEGAAMPLADVLPEDLKPLARRNAIELSDARWAYDVDRLLGVIEGAARPRGRIGAAGRMRSWSPRRRLAAGLSIAVLVALGVGIAVTGGGGPAAPHVATTIGPLPLGGEPGRSTVANREVWVPLGEKSAVAYVETAAPYDRHEVAVPGYSVAVAAGDGLLWVVDGSPGRAEVRRIGLDSHELLPTPKPMMAEDEPIDILFAHEHVWTANCACSSKGPGTVSRIDPASGATQQIRVGKFPHGIGADHRYVWVAVQDGVQRIDPASGKVVGGLIKVVGLPTDVAVDGTGIWTTSYENDEVVRIDPDTLEQTHIEVGDRPWSVVLGDRFLWVSHAGDDSLRWIDTRTRTVAGTRFAGSPKPESAPLAGDGVAFDQGTAWLASRTGRDLRGLRP